MNQPDTKRPRRRPPRLEPLVDLARLLDGHIPVEVPEPTAKSAGPDTTVVPLPPAADEAKKLAVTARRLAVRDDAFRARVLTELNAALGEATRARVAAYLAVPIGPDLGPERAAALDEARRTEGGWPDQTREFAEPDETGWVIPVPRSMSEAEAGELVGAIVGLAPLGTAARARVLTYLNALFEHRV